MVHRERFDSAPGHETRQGFTAPNNREDDSMKRFSESNTYDEVDQLDWLGGDL
ncbi:hypothetical protein SEA_OBLADI_146 [Gordonia phage ObLaDi]|uniref:Uncharacterized protein n=1 Tax=Gordonia phage ObLaDi TaxID=2978487 RepID=A0A977PR47_9CAUD|nr:hypothetical protein SEA_OBLADI_146 [Gordonia phage ObLaDi]